MKTPTTGFKNLTLILVMSLALGACANKSEDNNRAAGRAAGEGTTGVTPGSTGTCSNPNMEWGKVFEQQSPRNLEPQIKAFISATMDPKALGEIGGTIDSKTGVDVKAHFKFDSTGNLVPESSSMSLKIADSFVGSVYTDEDGNQVVVDKYYVNFSAASEGFIDRNSGNFEVVFADSFGTITFRGRQNGDRVTGTIEFYNKVAVSGYSPAAGKLGDFTSYACSMIQQ